MKQKIGTTLETLSLICLIISFYLPFLINNGCVGDVKGWILFFGLVVLAVVMFAISITYFNEEKAPSDCNHN